jgi:hypothetical protein
MSEVTEESTCTSDRGRTQIMPEGTEEGTCASDRGRNSRMGNIALFVLFTKIIGVIKPRRMRWAGM